MEKTSKLERLSYGGFFAGQNLVLILTLQFLLIFYTDVVMLPTNIIVALFLFARIWDAVNDPIMGIIALGQCSNHLAAFDDDTCVPKSY